LLQLGLAVELPRDQYATVWGELKMLVSVD
jgi:hypothetical protein